ncbi:MAG: nitroreductase/quinone reductase family protein [Nitrososphaerota archaeon]|nr:nitroreductase family deazaflavin-dependent oxidoreductase [Candidatus Calditenuaceae archaeon]MDW8073838.1 nitroreductase/quinone reductase family protein [Nitrososphaerota archaeon]
MQADEFLKALGRAGELEITTVGRRSGRRISLPVWFVVEDRRIYLLPVSGSDTNWYKNVLSNPSMELAVGGRRLSVVARPLSDKASVDRVVGLFKKKYGDSSIRRYYSKLDVCVEITV